MGFTAQAEKTLKANLSLLRGKTYFNELAQSKATRRPSKIDGYTLRRKAIILARRKLNHRLRLALVISLIFLVFVISVAWLNGSILAVQIP